MNSKESLQNPCGILVVELYTQFSFQEKKKRTKNRKPTKALRESEEQGELATAITIAGVAIFLLEPPLLTDHHEESIRRRPRLMVENMDTKIGALDTCKPLSNDISCLPTNGAVTIHQSPIPFNSADSTLGCHLARHLVQGYE
nr:uncharacterized protein LOC113708877 isoform X3 [Coffea arabica]